MRLPRDLSRNPLFQVNFRVRTASESTLSLPGIGIHHTDLDLGTSKFDMAIELCADKDRVSGFVEYNTALFETASIERISAEFVSLIAELAADPATPIAELKSFRSAAQFAARNRSAAPVRTFAGTRRQVDLAGLEGDRKP
jgi:non-ribosomal peptide synthetase component F